MSVFRYPLEAAFVDATRRARRAARACADACRSVEACEAADRRARTAGAAVRHRLPPDRFARADLERWSAFDAHVTRVRAAALAGAIARLAPARDAYERAERRRAVLERHRGRARAAFDAAADAREERACDESNAASEHLS